MDYRIAVCDDQQEARDLAQDCAAQWARQRGYSVEIQPFPSGDAFLFQYEDDKAWTSCSWTWRCPGAAAWSWRKKCGRRTSGCRSSFSPATPTILRRGTMSPLSTTCSSP